VGGHSARHRFHRQSPEVKSDQRAHRASPPKTGRAAAARPFVLIRLEPGVDMLTQNDLREIHAHGLTAEEVERQIGLFLNPPAPAQLERACTIGDGIRRLSESQVQEALVAYTAARDKGRLLKMVPASGAATRMFQPLLYATKEWPGLVRGAVAAQTGQYAEARATVAFMDGLERFAFFDPLCRCMARDGLDARRLAACGEFDAIVEYLITSRGLNYASLPKGMLAFHHGPDGARTPFEEHLVEAADFVPDASRVCRLHFTVSAEHQQRFAAHLTHVRDKWEGQLDVHYEVGFSVQQSFTDTIAVDDQNRLFRTADGRLLFRPGGHGSLIHNLNDLQADLVHLSNIDNVVPDRLKTPIVHWRRVLAGYLCDIQRRVHEHAESVARVDADNAAVDAALAFVRHDLDLGVPERVANSDAGLRREFLLSILDRPVRVCGMVPNSGEPGGGPFWVRGRNGELTRQIVESAQVDANAPAQQRIFNSATHFNPVDLICGVRDWQGRCFDLRRHVDPDAVFLSTKSHEGRHLEALEHPGLWNGGMADWTTIFVEVPLFVFNPVKTLLDLLRPEHQPG
jgi:hypothetical protein